MKLSLRDLSRIGGLVAAAIVLKIPFFALPNVELFTLTYFFIGYRYGTVWGLLIACGGEFLYSIFNPYGAALPPVLVAQVVGMGLVGLAGGLAARLDPAAVFSRFRHWAPAVAGGITTLVFDVLTNVAMVWTLGNLWQWLVAGIPFSALHIGINCLLFAFAFPILGKIIPPRRSARVG